MIPTFLKLSPLVALALLGAFRIGLSGLNRSVFGHKEEKPVMKFALISMPFVLLLLSSLSWFMLRDLSSGIWTAAGLAGVVWTALTAITASVWVINIFRHRLAPKQAGNVTSAEPRVLSLRRAHVPYAWLRRLGAHNDVYDLEITNHRIVVDDLPDAFEGYSVAFLSDTHVASFMRRELYRRCVDEVNAAAVDLVLLGGDFVSRSRDIPLLHDRILDGLKARDGIYGVLGNHDYWSGAEQILTVLEEGGVRMLENESVAIRRGNERIHLAAVDEIYRGKPDVEAAYEDIPEGEPVLLLSHHPDTIDLLRNRRADLFVCGHTHGGQIRVPFLGPLVVPSRHEFRYVLGFHRVGRVLMYVGRGIGAVPPLRILCRPEVAIFSLHCSRKTDDGHEAE